jgi:hypothetical protein
MWKRIGAIAIAVVAHVALRQTGHALELCGNFGYPPSNDQLIATVCAPAVVRVRVGLTHGSGYFIDTALGYLLTAAHVVAPALATPGTQIELDVPGLAQPLQARVVKAGSAEARDDDTPSDSDLALLQVTASGLPAIARANIRPLDLSFYEPPANAPVTVIGYPAFAGFKQRTRTGKVSGGEGYLIAVDETVDNGDSGSPLLDDQGIVIATCTAKTNLRDAHYLPMSAAVFLLKGLPLSKAVTALDEKIRQAGPNAEAVRMELRQSLRPGGFRNVDLVGWAWYIAANRAKYKPNELFRCPLAHAYSDRRLPDSIIELGDLAPKAAIGRAALQVAQRDRSVGKDGSRHAELAVRALRAAIQARVRSVPEVLPYAVCAAGALSPAAMERGKVTVGDTEWLTVSVEAFAGTRREATADSARHSCGAVKQDQNVSSLLQDYALANLVVAQARTNRSRDELLHEAAVSAALANATTPALARQGQSLALVGDVLRSLGRKEASAAAYATAYARGYRPDWVSQNWLDATGSAGLNPAVNVGKQISTAPRLDTRSWLDAVAIDDKALGAQLVMQPTIARPM